MAKQKPKKKVSNILIVLICIMIVLYTAANFALQYFVSVEVSPTLTTAWFTFWGTELMALAGIRITKEIKGNKDEPQIKEDTTENNEI